MFWKARALWLSKLWHHNFFSHKKLLTQNTEEELTGHKISGRTSTTGAPSNASSCKCGVKETSKIVGGQEAIVSFTFIIISLQCIYFLNFQPGGWPWIVVFSFGTTDGSRMVKHQMQKIILVIFYHSGPGRLWGHLDSWQLGGHSCTLPDDTVQYIGSKEMPSKVESEKMSWISHYSVSGMISHIRMLMFVVWQTTDEDNMSLVIGNHDISAEDPQR